MSHNFIAICKDNIPIVRRMIRISKRNVLRLRKRGSPKIRKGGKKKRNRECVSIIIKTIEGATCAGINEPARIALYLANAKCFIPRLRNVRGIRAAEIGRVGDGPRDGQRGS